MDDAMRPLNVDVMPNAPIDRVLFNEAKQVVGVLTAAGKTINCNEVILTNGSLGKACLRVEKL